MYDFSVLLVYLFQMPVTANYVVPTCDPSIWERWRQEDQYVKVSLGNIMTLRLVCNMRPLSGIKIHKGLEPISVIQFCFTQTRLIFLPTICFTVVCICAYFLPLF